LAALNAMEQERDENMGIIKILRRRIEAWEAWQKRAVVVLTDTEPQL